MITALAILASLYLGTGGLIYMKQDEILFHPDKQDFKSCGPCNDLGAKAVVLSHDGEEVRYYIREVKDAKKTIIFHHGNAGSACGRAFVLHFLKDLPINIILAEYPGYSNDNSRVSEESFLSNADAMMDHLQSQYNTSWIYFGESIGSGVSNYLAHKYPAEKLILNTPYSSITDLAQDKFPYYPAGLILKNKFQSTQWAPKITAPVLILHGDHDQVIPLQFSQKLAKYYPSPPQFKIFEDGHHNDLYGRKGYWETVKEFIMR